MDVLLGSNKDFLLGRWLEAAKALGTTVLVSQSQQLCLLSGSEILEVVGMGYHAM